ncbi:hypothetical protein B0T11DRAFT_52832 [Plectosphaerella cucumerina]|uniref:Uncharacterized protein n=1 Tax=Plectosphaerella cucumerina TaxID=40658 RepID=A0A8K0X691_9PEZI|nr:hypothetical protein B0T11DRAFT_52832 [Plectosphaerella cucumerina]
MTSTADDTLFHSSLPSLAVYASCMASATPSAAMPSCVRLGSLAGAELTPRIQGPVLFNGGSFDWIQLLNTSYRMPMSTSRLFFWARSIIDSGSSHQRVQLFGLPMLTSSVSQQICMACIAVGLSFGMSPAYIPSGTPAHWASGSWLEGHRDAVELAIG